MTEEVKKEEKPQEDWMTKKWRPMMAMMYMVCCLCDFALFPIMFTVVQFWEVQAANDAFRQWVPITLQGGGLFHVAMGAVLGVSAYGRTQEKVAGATNVSTSTPALPTSGVSTPTLSSATPVVPVQASVPASVYTPPPAPINTEPAQVVAGFGGKAAPPPAPQPLI
jgi:hypothetical protein